MILVFFRLFFRLFVLLIAVFSVFYFYVLGYKYDNNLGFVETYGTYLFEDISSGKEKTIIINNRKYYLANNNLILSNFINKKSCGKLKIGNFKKFVCYDKGTNYIVNISKDVIKIEPVELSLYKKLDIIKTDDVSEKYRFIWHNITFIYYKNGDIVYKDSISSKKLINFPNIEFVGYSKSGLYIVKNDRLYFMNLIAN